GEGVTVGDQSRIEAHCVIGDYVQVGSNCLLYPNVTIYQDCRIGDRVILHSGAVIGADGFKYEFLNGRLTKIPQVGNVVLEAEVEVGANSTIDRAGFSETRIGSRTKIDNLVHIAHNCIIGSDCIIVGQTGIAGSTTLGRGVIVAGQVGIGDHTTIGDGAKIGAKAGLKGNFPAGAELLGSPAVPVDEFMKIYTASRRLPKMLQRLQPLLDQLEAEEKAGDATELK
ncbi:MAG: UDP-3-O-(3-hydroxymyristoyl)glucosamine N-acyltransferase, partial [Candidatus Sumerlaeia bacterium]|nr:UDP-3-O-(3-hydroxymyristoyl)glucosamine N-acyltransferase [Candidatus Sumerlaeia bacterium]